MKIKFAISFFILFVVATNISSAQDSVLIHYLLKRISEEQIKSDSYFLAGIFPSYISNKEKFSERKKDNDIFFNGLIDYTLGELKPLVNGEEQLLIDSILANSKPLYRKFKNQKERNTYNFWRTDSAHEYPYASFLKLFGKKITLPDDMDDTVLSLLALDADDSTAEEVHQLMQSFINTDTNKVRSVIKEYDDLPAYSTWFGKKFPVVFDVSVLCNVLSFVQKYNLKWTQVDSASLEVIARTIQKNYHITEPMYASPYYGKTSIILYHIARLMSIKEIPQLETLKIKLITDAANELSHSNNILEKIILSTAIIKWGYNPPSVGLPSATDIEMKIEKNDFAFFIGNVPSYFHDAFRKYATTNDIGLFYHYCPAWNDVLLLEYLVLKDHQD
jgi:hypothetical protein